MKSLVEFITEAKRKPLEPEEVSSYLSQGIHHDGDVVTVVGKPFTNEEDEQYKVAQRLLKDADIKLSYTLKDAYRDIKDADEIDYWVIFIKNGNGYVAEYGPKGVTIYDV